MAQITIGQVAGVIAAAIFVARLWAPTGLTLILSGLLKDKNSATTWTVSSRAFQRSLWPSILQSDSSQTRGVKPGILLVTRLVTWTSLLITLASIITPLGLYSVLNPSGSVHVTFQYLQDTSPFGLATPSRSNLPFSRYCGDVACPFSDTVAVEVVTGAGPPNPLSENISFTYPYGISSKVPQIIQDIYSSGTSQNTTISNFFDIQWRLYYTTTTETPAVVDNGSAYLVSGFRNMQSLVMNNHIQVVEGLVVDMVNGGVGLRNHIFPPGLQHGVTWSEDLLFVEPETVCVNTNLTLDYAIAENLNATTTITNPVLTDRGGFINLSPILPEPNITDSQSNPDLWTRAYLAAWLNNAYSAMYYNVTDDNFNATTGKSGAFSYLNSALNKTFQLPAPGDSDGFEPYPFQSLEITTNFGDFLNLDSLNDLTNTSDPAASGRPPNPFYVSTWNFTKINNFCENTGSSDTVNVTNIFLVCGLIHGAPQRQNPGHPYVFESGSQWSQPLYTCASTLKATVKTVTFSYNGTDASLESLAITSIQDKEYSDGQALPLWGVENIGNAALLEQMYGIAWGLVSDEYVNHEAVSTVRQNSLYLPSSNGLAILNTFGLEFFPAADAFVNSMGPPYVVSFNGDGARDTVDYTGIVDVGMLVRWQNLSRSAELVSSIPNFIWTDVAASAIVGTRGVLGPGNNATENTVAILVTPIISQVKYHWPYAIPALLAALVLLLITLAAITTFLFGHNSIARLRLHLQRLSPGRIFTTMIYPNEPNGMTTKSKEWAKVAGQTSVDLSGERPTVAGVVGTPEKPHVFSQTKPAALNHYLQEVDEEGDEHRNGRVEGPTDGQRFLQN